jgi:hypothetical protein
VIGILWETDPNVASEFARDSPLEGMGFEPSVPRKAPGILAVSAHVRAVLPLVGNQAEAT